MPGELNLSELAQELSSLGVHVTLQGEYLAPRAIVGSSGSAYLEGSGDVEMAIVAWNDGRFDIWVEAGPGLSLYSEEGGGAACEEAPANHSVFLLDINGDLEVALQYLAPEQFARAEPRHLLDLLGGATLVVRVDPACPRRGLRDQGLLTLARRENAHIVRLTDAALDSGLRWWTEKVDPMHNEVDKLSSKVVTGGTYVIGLDSFMVALVIAEIAGHLIGANHDPDRGRIYEDVHRCLAERRQLQARYEELADLVVERPVDVAAPLREQLLEGQNQVDAQLVRILNRLFAHDVV